MSVNDEYLKLLPFWDKLSETEKAFVADHAVLKHYRKGQLISSGSVECLGMILMLDGELRAYVLSEEGREITLFRIKKGDTCVLSASCVINQITFETHICAQSDSIAVVINSGAFSILSRGNIYVRCYMYELLITRFSSVMWVMQQILFNGFDKRLASFLIDESERCKCTEIRMTHEEIATYTNSAREVVARMLKRFASEGLVDLRRGTVVLKDIEALKKLCD